MCDSISITNEQTTDLLSRFAAVSQRLKGTGAPGMPEWCIIRPKCKYSVIAGHDAQDKKNGTSVFNDEACLAGCVMWAMEVAEWCRTQKLLVIETPYLSVVGHNDDEAQWTWGVSQIPHRSPTHDSEGDSDTLQDASCHMLESIADAIGGG